jgi:ATP-dependent DNA helicase RecG
MEMAIAAMNGSVAEQRADGKASPRVGAVLFLDGDIIEASRGELRQGDHAEFTLLERKCRDRCVDGGILFTTLEPCAPGARSHLKLSCAERIINARIKEVWVGIEDPDPTVDRKGIKYLQENGVTVHMFERELQETIRDANKEFIEQALERAAAADEEQKPKLIVLSTLEDAFANAVLDNFSLEALEQYRTVAKVEESIGTPEFHQRLALQGLLKQEGGRWIPTGFGLLLFGKEPRVAMQHAGLLGTIHYADSGEETRDFDGPQVLVPEQALQWLRDKLPNPIDRSEARRREVNEALYELAREGIVNAIVHRDYGIAGAKCQLTATANTITVMSPGMPIDPITLEQMQSFTAPMLSRNPVLHYVFAQMELAEERGLGLKSMKSGAEQAGLPLPRYSSDGPYLILTLFRNQEAAIGALPEEVLESLNASERKGWQWIATKGRANASQYSEELGVDVRTARRHLNKFVEVGLLRKRGAGPSTEYEVL